MVPTTILERIALLGLLSRFGDKVLGIWAVCLQDGTTVPEGWRSLVMSEIAWPKAEKSADTPQIVAGGPAPKH